MAEELTPAQDSALRLVKGLDEPAKAELRAWWKNQGLPPRFADLTDEQVESVLAAVDRAVGPPF